VRRALIGMVEDYARDFPDISLEYSTCIADPSLGELIGGLYTKTVIKESPELNDMVEKGDWRDKFQKFGNVFLCFCMKWMRYTEKLLSNAGTESWVGVDGYVALGKVILKKITDGDIMRYPLDLKTAACSLLANPCFLDPLVMAVFKKTK
jgi:hypothetical protein